MSAPITVTAENFRSTVIDSDKPVLVDFWAEWCGPCKKLSPVLDEVAAELGDEAIVAKVNVDEQRQLGAMFQIMSIPTVLLFVNGEKVADIVGVNPKSKYVATVREHA
ncbi:thioredoxin [Corynebacterium sp. 13CS0277]|uniref:thioredoxin n=1 Tax=Corynebacterium sp. 13CS0277 TaxID=2071994 RepID=UPI000D02BD01|nr:thioredoxin [Corynebacterium sp. 13CS0277]PRQ11091.1 thioredoxin [Corynebacterium sp. 13CS0277]